MRPQRSDSPFSQIRSCKVKRGRKRKQENGIYHPFQQNTNIQSITKKQSPQATERNEIKNQRLLY